MQTGDIESAGWALRRLLNERGVTFGSAIRASFLDAPSYYDWMHWSTDIVTPEQSLIPAVFRPDATTYDFSGLDRIYAFAKDKGKRIFGHTLVWDNPSPKFPQESSEFHPLPVHVLQSTDSHFIEEEVFGWMHRVIARIGDKVDMWVVINEAVSDSQEANNPPFRRNHLARNWSEDYVGKALQKARELAPRAELFLCDYNVLVDGVKHANTLAVVDALHRRGYPLDGIACQGHFELRSVPSVSDMRERIANLQRRSLRVIISELDVRMRLPTTNAKLADQARAYESIFSAALSQGINHINVWGASDAHSFVPEFFPGEGAALPFDYDGEKGEFLTKPAWFRLRDFLAKSL